MGAYTAVQYKGQRRHGSIITTTADSDQDVMPSSSAGSNSQLPLTVAESPDQAGSILQVDAQALLVASAGSDPSWQLFAVLWDSRPGSVGGRS